MSFATQRLRSYTVGRLRRLSMSPRGSTARALKMRTNEEQTSSLRMRVPRYLFKLVYDATPSRSWTHWQENREGERVSAPISYRELVRRTGVEFLPTAGR